MRKVVGRLLDRVPGHEQAVVNARQASTDLSRRRVEREEVEIFLAALQPRGSKSA